VGGGERETIVVQGQQGQRKAIAITVLIGVLVGLALAIGSGTVLLIVAAVVVVWVVACGIEPRLP
jgi:hypothetical protein